MLIGCLQNRALPAYVAGQWYQVLQKNKDQPNRGGLKIPLPALGDKVQL